MNFNKLIPELSISNFEKTIQFYTEILKFSIEYQRVEEGFAFLSLGDAQLMVDQIDKGRTWKTGEFDHPLGKGISIQIIVENIEPLLKNLKKHNVELFMEPEEKWYRKNDILVGNRQFLVQDPDGYLLRFAQNLGTKPI